MTSELPKIDRDKATSPHAQEVEFALILSQMINAVKQDPSQMRLAVYEFARAKLKLDVSWADEAERERLATALESAIHGVEVFSVRRDQSERAVLAQIGAGPAPAESTAMVEILPASPAELDALDVTAPPVVRLRPELPPPIKLQTWVPLSTLLRFCIGALLLGALAVLAIYALRPNAPAQTAVTEPAVIQPPNSSPPAAAVAVPPTPAIAASPPPFPLPTDYGVYALSNAALTELHALPESVPDKRIAMSTPINRPSSTTLADGKMKFVVFGRDFAGNAPDRIEVRVVARVARAMTFDANGKPRFVPVSDAWNIRNISHEFRVRPIQGNPEMLLIQAENADFELPAGRYVLVLRNQGYDFTVAGKVTDPSQCLERTDAANGTFYSDCQKP
jgi:hypothetical protein